MFILSSKTRVYTCMVLGPFRFPLQYFENLSFYDAFN